MLPETFELSLITALPQKEVSGTANLKSGLSFIFIAIFDLEQEQDLSTAITIDSSGSTIASLKTLTGTLAVICPIGIVTLVGSA